MNRPAPPPSKFFLEDIVRCNDRDPSGTEDDLAIVLRHWHDSDPATTLPEYRDDPLNRALETGEIGISYMVSGAHEIVHEKDYFLVDRSLQPGDLVKLSVHDVQSGVVLESKVEVKLEHAVSMTQYAGWVSSDELENATEVYVGDYVIYDDWVGQVEELHDEATAELDSGELFTCPMLGGRFQVGDRGADMLPEQAVEHLQRLGMVGTPEVLVFVKPTVMAVAWLAVNQSLDQSVVEAKQRPKQFWTADEFRKLCIVRPRAILRISDRVRFKDASLAEMHGVRATHHGARTGGIGVIESDVLVVRETKTTVRVLWQSGAITDGIPATALIPYANPDEYDCWPGDYVLWKGDEGETRAAVVQHVDAADRTAQVFWRSPPAGPASAGKPASYGLVSVLEVDPHGMSGPVPEQPDAVGVRRGDFVFIHKAGTTNGASLPSVPKIGELQEWTREIDHDGGWKKEMAGIGAEYAQRFEAAKHGAVQTTSGLQFTRQGLEGENEPRVPWRNPSHIDWFGEVVNLKTSGDVEINLPSGGVALAPLERLTLLMDGRDGAQGIWVDENGVEVDNPGMQGAAHPGLFGSVPAVAQVLTQFLGLLPGANHAHRDDENHDVEMGSDGEDGSWEDYRSIEGDEVDEFGPTVDNTISTSPPSTEAGANGSTAWPKPTNGIITTDATQTPGLPNGSPSTSPPVPSTPLDEEDEEMGNNSVDADGGPWKRFKVLPSAPHDHAFLSKGTKGQPSRQFMGRLSKEYKLLSTSLPETIIVRAYEDRTDLLRSLIVGPENTPYEGAPFVIDWFLEDTFPASPPQAHFHSWTNGNGRVNPNLYEEGKVCLSILGTWAGDKSECWSPARSSLMQALVSIQGLVLVKEPWFCEPQFENLRGTQEGIVNSRLYSEKAYVLSRGFVRRALEFPPEGLQKEIDWMFVEQGKLAKVIDDAKALITASQKAGGTRTEDIMRTMPGWEDKAVPKLTPGAVLPVQRTLAKLETILAERAAGRHGASTRSSVS